MIRTAGVESTSSVSIEGRSCWEIAASFLRAGPCLMIYTRSKTSNRSSSDILVWVSSLNWWRSFDASPACDLFLTRKRGEESECQHGYLAIGSINWASPPRYSNMFLMQGICYSFLLPPFRVTLLHMFRCWACIDLSERGDLRVKANVLTIPNEDSIIKDCTLS